MPPRSVDTTGNPVAIASMMTVGRLSMPPSGSITLGSTKTFAAASRSRTCICGFAPGSSTLFCKHSSSICWRSSLLSGPSPMISHRNDFPRSMSNAQVRIKSANPFFGIKRPTAIISAGIEEKSARPNSARSSPL